MNVHNQPMYCLNSFPSLSQDQFIVVRVCDPFSVFAPKQDHLNLASLSFHVYEQGTNSSRDARIVFEILPQNIFFCARAGISSPNTEEKWTSPKPVIAKAVFVVGQGCYDN
jgi:hypothetical protein